MSRAKAVTHSHGARRDKCTDLAFFAEEFAKLERIIDDSYKEGYAAGVKAGKRLAKGKPELAKARGRQKVLHDILALQFVRNADSLLNNRGFSLGAAVAQYLKLMAPVWKDLNEGKPSRAALMRLYQRIKKGKHKIDPSMRRAYKILKGDRSGN
jgi:hypothetical protein